MASRNQEGSLRLGKVGQPTKQTQLEETSPDEPLLLETGPSHFSEPLQ